MALAQHRGMTILGIEDSELAFCNGIEALGSVGKELHILLDIKIGLGIVACRFFDVFRHTATKRVLPAMAAAKIVCEPALQHT